MLGESPFKSGVSVPTGSLLEPGKIALETLCGQDFLFGIERCGRRLGTGRPATRRRCPSASVDAFGRSAVPCSRVRAGKGVRGFPSSSSSPMPAPSTSAPDRRRPAVTTYPERMQSRRRRSHQQGQITLCCRFPVGPPPVIPAPTYSAGRRKNRDGPGKWAYEELTHSNRNADADHWQGIAKIDPIRYATAHKRGVLMEIPPIGPAR